MRMLIFIASFALFVGGCAEQIDWDNADWAGIGRTLSDYSQQLENQRLQRDNVKFITPQRNPNYWQERRAEQEYWNSQRRWWGLDY